MLQKLGHWSLLIKNHTNEKALIFEADVTTLFLFLFFISIPITAVENLAKIERDAELRQNSNLTRVNEWRWGPQFDRRWITSDSMDTHGQAN